MATASRGAWSSRTGFILAAAGSAIGLGNIWRFPYSAGESGGGAFVFIYILFVALIGIPVMLAELSIGRKTEKNPVGAFSKLFPGTQWKMLGGLGVVTGFGILAFYSVIAGWTIAYLYRAIVGDIGAAMTAEQSGLLFTELVGGSMWPILLSGLFLLLTILVVRGGVSGGIERATKILMPVLLVLLILLAIRSVTLSGGGEGLKYLFKPDFSKLTGGVVMSALGQAFFSLSLGMGAMITYGSYMPKSENLAVAGISVAFFDTIIAILAGLIIFPAIFHAGVDPAAGPGLVFVVLPTIFSSLPYPQLFAVAFYALLAIAALTSTISLLEVVVSYFVDERKWTREKASWVLGGFCFLLAIPSALSAGASSFLSNFLPESISFLGSSRDFLSIQNVIWGNLSLSIGALALCLFVGWKWGVKAAIDSLQESGHMFTGAGLWSVLIKFVCPIAVAATLIYMMATGNFL